MTENLPAQLNLMEIQQSLREIWDVIDFLDVGSGNIDLHGRRFINAGSSISGHDYVTRQQLTESVDSTRAAFRAVSLPNDVAAPGAVQNFAVAGVDGVFKATWDRPLTNFATLDDFGLQWATDAGFTAIVDTISLGVRFYAEGLDPEKTYWFRIAAHNTSGDTTQNSEAALLAIHPDGWGPWVSVGPVVSGTIVGALVQDTVIPDATVIASIKHGVNSELIGVDRPGGSPSGWTAVNKITVEVATDSSFTAIVATLKTTGVQIVAAQFVFVSSKPGHFFARARATNNIGDSGNSSTLQFDTDTSVGDTDVPGQPTLTLFNKGDRTKVAHGKIVARVDFSAVANRAGIWLAAAQFHTSSAMTNPEASPIFTPTGDLKGDIVLGESVFTDSDVVFPVAGSIVGKILMISYDDPWPGSPATRVFLAGIRARNSDTELAIYGVWSQPTGQYTYRIVDTLEDVDSGEGFVPFQLILSDRTRDRGYVELELDLPTDTTWYARCWVSNTFGRSNTAAASSGKLNMPSPNGTYGSLSTPSNTINDDGSADVQITWNYTKGTISPDGFEIMVHSSTGLPGTITEANAQQRYKQGLKQASGSQLEQFVIKAIDPTHSYSFAVRAYREVEGKLVYDSITDTANWRNHNPASQPKITDGILTDGSVVSFDQVAGKEVLTWVSRVTMTAAAWNNNDIYTRNTSAAHGLSNTPVLLAFLVNGTARYPASGLPGMHLARHVAGPITASAGTLSTITIDTTYGTLVAGEWSRYLVRITGGTGANQQRGITSHTGTVITVAANWTTTPDSTSIFYIVQPDGTEGDVTAWSDGTNVYAENPSTGSRTVKFYLFKENASF